MLMFFFADASINWQFSYTSVRCSASEGSITRDFSRSHLLPTTTMGIPNFRHRSPVWVLHCVLHSCICWQRRSTSSKDSLLSMLYTRRNKSPEEKENTTVGTGNGKILPRNTANVDLLIKQESSQYRKMTDIKVGKLSYSSFTIISSVFSSAIHTRFVN